MQKAPPKAPPQGLSVKDLLAPVTNSSRAKRLARALFGPSARAKVTGPDACLVSYDDHSGANCAVAKSFPEAFAGLIPDDLSVEDLLELAGPEFRALASLDFRLFQQSLPAGDQKALPGVRERFDKKLVLTRKERARTRVTA